MANVSKDAERVCVLRMHAAAIVEPAVFSAGRVKFDQKNSWIEQRVGFFCPRDLMCMEDPDNRKSKKSLRPVRTAGNECETDDRCNDTTAARNAECDRAQEA